MKHFSPIVFVVLFIIPLVLTACGDDGPADNAEHFLESMNRRDGASAKEYACDSLHETIDFRLASESSGEIPLVRCEEGDADEVNCTLTVGETEEQITLVMDDDDKVCGGDMFGSGVPDTDTDSTGE
jgi:hypothetical protein